MTKLKILLTILPRKANSYQLISIEWSAGHWFASTKLMDLGEKGRIHSNIPDSQTYKVIEIDSGKEIGAIAGVFDEVFVLAGRIWRIISIKDNVIKARRFNGKALVPLFQRHRNMGAFYWLLPKELKVKMKR